MIVSKGVSFSLNTKAVFKKGLDIYEKNHINKVVLTGIDALTLKWGVEKWKN